MPRGHMDGSGEGSTGPENTLRAEGRGYPQNATVRQGGFSTRSNRNIVVFERVEGPEKVPNREVLHKVEQQKPYSSSDPRESRSFRSGPGKETRDEQLKPTDHYR